MELSLCMIVKNEADVLERAVENARVFADEIVVVDTGSTDGTKAIAKRVADKTGEFKWRDDFAAARNYADSLATCPYKMWLDADDVVPLPSAKAISKLMRTLDPATDVVMLPYVLARDEFGAPKFSYYRERIVRNRADFMWRGRVHEAIAIHGNIIKAKPIILHAKPTGRASGTRNLDIYRKMAAEGHVFGPRETYYYARELYYNGEHDGAAREFERYLGMRAGYAANDIDACLMLSRCYAKLGDKRKSFAALFDSFEFALPTGEVCCEIAFKLFADGDYKRAAYWFKRAAQAKPDIDSGAFIDYDCYGFLPYIWLSVCYDKLGNRRTAYYWHRRARKVNPNHPSVIANQAYFESIGF